MAGQGRRFLFHGAFGTKAGAQAKEASRPGCFIKQVKIRGKRRWLVMDGAGNPASHNPGSDLLRIKL